MRGPWKSTKYAILRKKYLKIGCFLTFLEVNRKIGHFEWEGGVPAPWRRPWSFSTMHVVSSQTKIGGPRLIYLSLRSTKDWQNRCFFGQKSAIYQKIGPHPATFYDGASFLGAIWYPLLRKLGYEISAQSDHYTPSYGPLNLHRYCHFGPNTYH